MDIKNKIYGTKIVWTNHSLSLFGLDLTFFREYLKRGDLRKV